MVRYASHEVARDIGGHTVGYLVQHTAAQYCLLGTSAASKGGLVWADMRGPSLPRPMRRSPLPALGQQISLSPRWLIMWLGHGHVPPDAGLWRTLRPPSPLPADCKPCYYMLSAHVCRDTTTPPEACVCAGHGTGRPYSRNWFASEPR